VLDGFNKAYDAAHSGKLQQAPASKPATSDTNQPENIRSKLATKLQEEAKASKESSVDESRFGGDPGSELLEEYASQEGPVADLIAKEEKENAQAEATDAEESNRFGGTPDEELLKAYDNKPATHTTQPTSSDPPPKLYPNPPNETRTQFNTPFRTPAPPTFTVARSNLAKTDSTTMPAEMLRDITAKRDSATRNSDAVSLNEAMHGKTSQASPSVDNSQRRAQAHMRRLEQSITLPNSRTSRPVSLTNRFISSKSPATQKTPQEPIGLSRKEKAHQMLYLKTMETGTRKKGIDLSDEKSSTPEVQKTETKPDDTSKVESPTVDVKNKSEPQTASRPKSTQEDTVQAKGQQNLPLRSLKEGLQSIISGAKKHLRLDTTKEAAVHKTQAGQPQPAGSQTSVQRAVVQAKEQRDQALHDVKGEFDRIFNDPDIPPDKKMKQLDELLGNKVAEKHQDIYKNANSLLKEINDQIDKIDGMTRTKRNELKDQIRDLENEENQTPKIENEIASLKNKLKKLEAKSEGLKEKRNSIVQEFEREIINLHNQGDYDLAATLLTVVGTISDSKQIANLRNEYLMNTTKRKELLNDSMNDPDKKLMVAAFRADISQKLGAIDGKVAGTQFYTQEQVQAIFQPVMDYLNRVP